MKHVAVLMGGWSAEREISLRSGKACADALERQGFRVSRIDVARWVDGNVTSGYQSAQAKRNEQLPEDSAEARECGEGSDHRPQRTAAHEGVVLTQSQPQQRERDKERLRPRERPYRRERRGEEPAVLEGGQSRQGDRAQRNAFGISHGEDESGGKDRQVDRRASREPSTEQFARERLKRHKSCQERNVRDEQSGGVVAQPQRVHNAQQQRVEGEEGWVARTPRLEKVTALRNDAVPVRVPGTQHAEQMHVHVGTRATQRAGEM